MARVIVVILLFLTGCSTPLPNLPELERTFSEYRDIPKKHPLIIIPGLFGSMLIDRDGEVIWGKKSSVLKQKNFNNSMLLPIAGGEDIVQKENILRPTKLLESLVWVPSIYEVRTVRNLIHALQVAGGYKLGDINKPSREDNLYIFNYDWRLDNVENVKMLDKQIYSIKEAWEDPSLKVDVVAHSMGGLITRYYIKYGNRDVLDMHWIPPPTFSGAKNINKFFVVATPHMGTSSILALFNYGLPMWRIRPRINPETMLTWPSMYQLLPTQKSGLYLNANNEPLPDFELYNLNSWEKYKISIFSDHLVARLKRHYGDQADNRREQLKNFVAKMLRRADKFHEAITYDESTNEYPVPVLGYAGDCLLTPEYVQILGDGKMKLDKKELNEPGDGRVTRNSFLGLESNMLTKTKVRRSHIHLDSTTFICEAHSALIENSGFHEDLLRILLTEGASALKKGE